MTAPAMQGSPESAFADLRRQGIALIQRFAGQTWTDHNVHDPGITILEQLCYALTDLDYRARYVLPDLLSDGGANTYASLYGPEQILPTSPVTIVDLRKLVIDVDGVKNAWVDPVDEPHATYDAATAEVSHLASPDGVGSAATPSPNLSEIRVRGLYHVRIEKSNLIDRDGGAILRDVVQRLQACRPLGEDFQTIEVLDYELIRLLVTLEVDPAANTADLLARVYQALAAHLSPAVPCHTLDEMIARGWRVDEIFEGPLLDHGFIDSAELASLTRPTTLRRSDLIRVATAVPGVVAVKSLNFLTPSGAPSNDWLLDLDPTRTPQLDLQAGDIRLERHDVLVDASVPNARQLTAAAAPDPKTAPRGDLRPPSGRDRGISRYLPVQEQFPAAYGIGSAGLPPSASPARRAQAKQLQGYLALFDQLLTNEFAQVANAARLVSFADTPDSFFSQLVLDDETPWLGDVGDASDAATHAKRLRALSEDPWQVGDTPSVRRRNRFLDHLLARFGEQLSDFALGQPTGGPTVAQAKEAFLREYATMSRDRAAGFDYLALDGDDNRSGLERRVSRKLGIADPAERFYLVEHVLLRPVGGDVYQRGPMLRAVPRRDPYSLQLSFVFPGSAGRFRDNPELRKLVEQTVREETPAHLTAYVIWKDDPTDFATFVKAHSAWRERLRSSRLSSEG